MISDDRDLQTFQHYQTYVIPSDAAVQEVLNYAMWAKGGKQFVETNGRLPESWEEFRSWFRSNFDATRIFEIGCGSGYFGARLAEKGAKVLGIDPALDPSHREHPSKIYADPNLTLITGKLAGVETEKTVTVSDEFLVRVRGMEERILRVAKNSMKLMLSPEGDDFAPDLVLCVWMERRVNLSPVMRALGINSIFYVASSLGGTGVDFGECGCLGHDSLDNVKEQSDLDLIVSFRSGPEYREYRRYPYDARNVSLAAESIGIIQFRRDIPYPEFEAKRVARRMEDHHVPGDRSWYKNRPKQPY
jgi:SAM-dependent methyltransferase